MAPFVSVGCSVLLMLLPVFLLYKKTSIQVISCVENLITQNAPGYQAKVISLRVIRQLCSNFSFVLLRKSCTE